MCFHPGSFLERLCALNGDICIIRKCFLSIYTAYFFKKASVKRGPTFKNPPPRPLPSQPARNRTERVTEDTLLDFKANYHVTKIGRVLARALPAASGIAPPPLVEGVWGSGVWRTDAIQLVTPPPRRHLTHRPSADPLPRAVGGKGRGPRRR